MNFRVLLEKITPALRNIARKQILTGFYDEEDLYQEMCLYLWQTYSEGLPIGINEAYVIKGCEFHLMNYLRKGRKRFMMQSLNEELTEGGGTLMDALRDTRVNGITDIDNKLSIDDINNMDLSLKEKKVFSGLIKGQTVREIAGEMGISHVMVLKYKKNIIKKCSPRSIPALKSEGSRN